MSLLYNFLFIALPYVAIFVFVVGVIYRYRSTAFGYSSLSSQFLEGKTLFWGSVPFHFGLLIVLLGHVIAFLFPKGMLLWNSQPVRLLIFEVTGFAFALSMLVGLTLLFLRRISNARLRAVTSPMDICIEVLLLAQVILGVWIAVAYRWGSSWFAADLTPYLWSIFTLNPKIVAVSSMPLVIQLHIIGAFLIILVFPFTRLVHFLVAPLHYIPRPYQQVIWYWNRKTIRHANGVWSKFRPRNN